MRPMSLVVVTQNAGGTEPRWRVGRVVLVAMKRQDKADRIGELLDDLYPNPPVPLDHRNPYTMLVAVALSAQTTDKKVNEVTPALFDAASTPEEMSRLSPDEILGYIKQVGLAPTKARNLSTMAHQIVDAGGEIIADWTSSRAWPGSVTRQLGS
jgi:endonuclease-3